VYAWHKHTIDGSGTSCNDVRRKTSSTVLLCLNSQSHESLIETRLKKTRSHNRMKPIRVLIADDHALVRGGIRALVEKIAGMTVVGEAGKGKEALELVKELKPNLMLLDLTMPEGGGFEVLDNVTKNFPEVRVIVLTVHEAGEYAMRALREGAAGFLPKSAASTELEQAIQTVIRGEVYIRKNLLEYPKGTTKKELLNTLSPRQREVLRLIAEGLTTKQIAQELKIAVKTVETHRAVLMERLDIHDVAGLVRYAISVGLIQVE
jgi:DNA-binding NarL/FixJ family response regulator